ncbi:Ldh family oxidoreductase [Arvimicrobium flavum]|uniref:Ldh family oxidoreductase n=1 Tax=Arvimicrobium flavum TaxID=3393320 RepID=UPI00237A1086|nr:Ldh family oxidoreductase [Mesorhizobium shangrilense]
MADQANRTILVDPAVLEGRVFSSLRDNGADGPSAEATTRALMHASRLGVDSHGVRLVPHYAMVLKGGRVNGLPKRTIRRTAAATAVLDADDGLGHPAAYQGMELACEIARESGVGVVGIVRSSHFGAAGAYARAGAEAGFVALCTSNADSAVTLFDGVAPFHGTNPIAAAAPVAGGRPWLLDLATSSIPFNRVLLYRSLGLGLPADVAVDGEGHPTTEAELARTLLPLGGAQYGFKGAGLAGLATILSAVLMGMAVDDQMIQMGSEDIRTPRNMGQFCLAIDPERFGGAAAFGEAMAGYLDRLREAPARAGREIMAPGDREWKVEADRMRNGIPVDVDTARFLQLEG